MPPREHPLPESSVSGSTPSAPATSRRQGSASGCAKQRVARHAVLRTAADVAVRAHGEDVGQSLPHLQGLLAEGDRRLRAHGADLAARKNAVAGVEIAFLLHGPGEAKRAAQSSPRRQQRRQSAISWGLCAQSR